MIPLRSLKNPEYLDHEPANLRFYNLHPKTESFRDQVFSGLQASRKNLPAKFFYDKRGSQLFEQICMLDEYYLTRVETTLMERNLDEMVFMVGRDASLIEYGAGNTKKIRILLESLENPLAYVPIDISEEILLEASRMLALTYPSLKVLPIYADFTQLMDLPFLRKVGDGGGGSSWVAFFPGSTIGNFEPQAALEVLKTILRHVGSKGDLLVGVDLLKDPVILERAYNDSAGVTADFNLNLLSRVNQQLHGNFDLKAFRHLAFFNAGQSRIEMHIESLRDQMVMVEDIPIPFKKGETIHTENSYKYTVEAFHDLAVRAGFSPIRTWVDEKRLFSVHFLSAYPREPLLK